MTQRAVFSPGLRNSWKRSILAVLGMCASVVLVGCGGGGTSGGPSQGLDVCADNTFSGQTVICGYVINDGTVNGVNGANVSVKTSGGTTISSIRTYHNTASGKDGYFVLPVNNGGSTGALLAIDAPASGYLATYLRFNGALYDTTRTAQAGGQCIPAIPSLSTSGAGNIIPSISLFPDSSTPPPPVFVCPR